MPSGAVLENSLCVEVSVIVIDQFPYLWDFVLTGETDNEHTGCQQTSASCALTSPVFLQIKAKKMSENMLNGFCIFISPLHSNSQTRYHPKLFRPYDLGSFVRMDQKHDFTTNALARILTLHTQLSLCCFWYSQACLPLSYAAQIPTTPNPDLANVRVSLSNLDQEVRKCSARIWVSVRACVCACVCMVSKCVFERERKMCSVFLCECVSVLVCVCVMGWMGVWQLVRARANEKKKLQK